MHASKADLPARCSASTRAASSTGARSASRSSRMPANFPPDESPFKGLPDDRCQCPHWGYVSKGSFTVTYLDGSRGASSTPARSTTCAQAISSRRSSRSS